MSRGVGALVMLIGAAYACLAFRVLEPDAVHTIDTAVKYVEACTLWNKHFTSMGMVNRGAFIDPAGVFFPFRPPFVFHSPAGWQSIFPTAASLVMAPMTRWGLAGITVPALAGAVGLLLALHRLARDVPARGALPVVLGVATMLWYYAVLPNEHAPAAALTTLALGIALWSDDRRQLALAGVLVGTAALLRDESVLVAPGLVIARYLGGHRTLRALLIDGALTGAMVALPLVIMGLVDTQLYQRPLAAHLLHAMGPLQRWLPAQAAAALPELVVLSPAQRFDVIVHQWLVGLGTTAQKAEVVVLLAAAIAVRRLLGSAVALAGVLGWLVAARIADVTALLLAPKFVGGLYRLCPFLIFAVLPLPPGSPSSRARRLALATAAVFLGVTFLTINTIGGKPLGPRMLMPIIPLLALAAWESIVVWTRQLRDRWTDGMVGVLGLALIGVSILIEAGSTIPAFVLRNRSDYVSVKRLSAEGSRVIVIDNSFTIQLVTPLYPTHVVLLAQDAARASELANSLYAARVPSFTLLSRAERPPLAFAPYRRADEFRDGRLVVQQWHR
jgi:hypothetical protein